ncbi:protein-tyrosine phosphatase family protein [Desertihabitans aurantiacus]|uniref:protein-tyrosine phosphatase family protein n=1 Tax=Desertihabitans aurantiacus TaxID=2282477 RepID=UPI000DF7E3A3|nr:protein-tyrosine phosphatase family protein [Desertihabitans aurantiacus]
MSAPWPPQTPGLLRLPSGLVVRGRSTRQPDDPVPHLSIRLAGRRPPARPFEVRWVRWPDLWLPTDEGELLDALAAARRRAGAERVEVACTGGRGRTGTALACLAVLDGVPADGAVAWVRERWDRRAVETPWQARLVRRTAAHTIPAPDA